MSITHEARMPLRADPRLTAFAAAGLVQAADVHVAQRVAALGGETDADVLLAVALAVRAARQGAVCLDLDTVAEQPVAADGEAGPDALPWPEPEAWWEAVRRSPLSAPGTTAGVLRVDQGLLYLDRHWREEVQVCDDLTSMAGRRAPELDQDLLERAVERLFGPGWEEQRAAALAAAGRWLSVLTGGPGTGKTASVARMLVVLSEQHEAVTGRAPRIGLAAPTGKAAARLQESVEREAATLADEADRARLAGLSASTVHRLLGWRPGSNTRFRHHRENPLPYDLILIDEVSMVSLAQMARLLEAVRPGSRLILVGDPDQLASVEAGAVLADLVDGFSAAAADPVSRLTVNHRIAVAGHRAEQLDALATAVRDQRVDDALDVLAAGGAVRLVDPSDQQALASVYERVVDAAYDVMAAAQHPDASDPLRVISLLEEHRLLCAHREGFWGVGGQNSQVARLLAERTGINRYDEWYAGRPVLITANDRGLRLSNGDLGVTVRMPDGRLRVVIRVEGQARLFAPTRLSAVDTVYAMTVHKSQGSEARSVTVVLPPADSPLLSRELFYTAVTRAREQVTIVGSAEALRAAIEHKVQRASGLAARLAGVVERP